MISDFLGNIIPDYSILDPKTPRDTEAAIELACNFNYINSLIVVGHSDCKVCGYNNLKYHKKLSRYDPCQSIKKAINKLIKRNNLLN